MLDIPRIARDPDGQQTFDRETATKIYVLHENAVWVEPLRLAFDRRALPFTEWPLVEGRIDLSMPPPEGVFYNRMSASSHTRGHRYAPEMTSVVLAWLESHGRRVVNDSRALHLEVNKSAQYAALAAHGLATPKTVCAVGRDAIVRAAQDFAPGPVILKPNRGGKGQGVILFASADSLEAHVDSYDFEESVDGVTLVQEFIDAPEPFITRAEFIGGRFLYALRVDTSQGFELCPADACATTDGPGGQPSAQRFHIVDDIADDLKARFEAFLAASGIEIAGIEFITAADGSVFTYDVNTNTNYNADAEAIAGVSGMDEIARFLGCELARRYFPTASRLRLAC